MRAVFAGNIGFETVQAGRTFAAAGLQLLCVNSAATHEAFAAQHIPHSIASSAVQALAEMPSVAIVICQLDAAVPGNLDPETHAFIRASAALYTRIVVVTTANDLERVLQHVNEGPAIRLPAFVRERIASKALQACSEADAWLASQLSAGQEQAVVLVVGSGGREHAIAMKLAESHLVARVVVAPGNGGTATAGGKISNVSISAEDTAQLVAFARDQQVSLVVVGPEAPLVAGLADALAAHGVACFGPSAAAAQLEASKAFSKDFMARHGIRTARYKTFKDFALCQAYIEACTSPVVVKASGLAAGKGVIIPANKQEAVEAARAMLLEHKLGSSGSEVVVEEMMEGEEISVLAFCDGKIAVGMPPAQDHKRVFDNDQGPNTGGMGAYAPAPAISKAAYDEVMAMIQRTLDGLAAEGILYRGVIYAGIMLTAHGPAMLEYNCRFGDPETQALLPLLDSDLYEILSHCAHGHLLPQDVRWKHKYACAVVVSAPGYPASYPKGLPISGLADVGVGNNGNEVQVFHAGTTIGVGHQVLTNGGRVLAVTGVGSTIGRAVQRSYRAVQRIHFEGMHYRRDIAHRAVGAPLRIGVLGSSRGTSLQPLIRAIEAKQVNASIEIVLSNVADAFILQRAQEHNIPARYISSKKKPREQFDDEVTQVLEDYRVDLVLLVGYMRILSGRFCSRWKERCLNIHPSLLPDFAGGMDLQVHEAVLAAKRSRSGCTVHFVTEQVDGGPVFVQLECDVAEDETPQSLKSKVQALEGRALIEAVQKFQTGGSSQMPLTYKAAGVDIAAGDSLVEQIKPVCKSTSRPGCDVELGGFGGMFDLAAAGYDPAETLLVSGTDGVGTKLLIAQQMGKHDTIGVDLVAMCVNDILVAGAEPLFFLDYYACGKLDVAVAADVVRGIADGCKQAGCGLIGGETAEMPSLYASSEYDMAGFAVGAVLKSATLPRNIAAGDVVLGLRSSGIHSNGYSLVRKCVERAGLSYSDPCPFEPNQTLGEVLLTPTRIYTALLLPLIKEGLIHGLAHITGGGLLGNLPRVLPKHLAATIDLETAGWSLPPLFRWLQQTAAVDKWEMLRVFNSGVGMVMIVSKERAEEVSARCSQKGEHVLVLGSIIERPPQSSEQVLVQGEFV